MAALFYTTPVGLPNLTICCPFALHLEERCIFLSHGLQKQTTIEKQVPNLATRLSDKQASMAGSAMGCTIPAPVVGFMICADWVIRANPQALQSALKDMGKSRSGCDKTTKRPLGARARGVNQYAAAVEIAPSHPSDRPGRTRARGEVVGNVWKCKGSCTSSTAFHSGSHTGCHIDQPLRKYLATSVTSMLQ